MSQPRASRTLRRRASIMVHAAMWACAITPIVIEIEGRGYPSGIVGLEEFFDGLWLLGWIIIVMLVGAVAAAMGLRHWLKGGRLLPRWRWIGLAMLTFVAGLAALRFDVIFTVRFDAGREAFERAAAAEEFPATPARIGGFNVLDITRDPRGGVYFKTGETPDIIDTLSFGFVIDPNADGSPFGNAEYRLVPLGDGWHRFEVSNDW